MTVRSSAVMAVTFITLLGGATLWRHQMLPGVATPITYRLDGRQSVAVTSGATNGRVFALDASSLARVACPSERRRGRSRSSKDDAHWDIALPRF